MRVMLELFRIIFIFLLLGSLIWLIVEKIYANTGAEKYGWIGGLSIYVFLFVLYRNRWQFSGWYKGKGRQKLSGKTTKHLYIVSITLFVSPFIVSGIEGLL